MKLTMKTLLASPTRVVQAGQTAEFPDDEAKALLAAGAAVKPQDDPARARVAEPEDADGRPSRNASTDVWRTYAEDQGMDPTELGEMSRNEIRDLFYDEES